MGAYRRTLTIALDQPPVVLRRARRVAALQPCPGPVLAGVRVVRIDELLERQHREGSLRVEHPLHGRRSEQVVRLAVRRRPRELLQLVPARRRQLELVRDLDQARAVPVTGAAVTAAG